MVLCKATATGSTTEFTDALNLYVESRLMDGRQGIFSGGTALNLGRIVRITDSDKLTQTITFTPAVPTATLALDELELWNERDEGITPGAVHNLIDDAIADITENAPVPVTSDAFDFASAAPVIQIDDLEVDELVDGANWEAITGVDWQDEEDIWHPIPSAELRVDRHARTLELRDRARWQAEGRAIRVRGANLPQALATDAASTSVNFEWITHQVAAQAMGIRLEKAYDRKDVEGRMLYLQQRADQLRAKSRLYLRGRFWRLS
jgi:hypothetical protein